MKTILVGNRTETTTKGDAQLQRRRFKCQVAWESEGGKALQPIDDFEIVFASSKPPELIKVRK